MKLGWVWLGKVGRVVKSVECKAEVVREREGWVGFG